MLGVELSIACIVRMIFCELCMKPRCEFFVVAVVLGSISVRFSSFEVPLGHESRPVMPCGRYMIGIQILMKRIFYLFGIRSQE
jgi:hypothetical protein